MSILTCFPPFSPAISSSVIAVTIALSGSTATWNWNEVVPIPRATEEVVGMTGEVVDQFPLIGTRIEREESRRGPEERGGFGMSEGNAQPDMQPE